MMWIGYLVRQSEYSLVMVTEQASKNEYFKKPDGKVALKSIPHPLLGKIGLLYEIAGTEKYVRGVLMAEKMVREKEEAPLLKDLKESGRNLASHEDELQTLITTYVETMPSPQKEANVELMATFYDAVETLERRIRRDKRTIRVLTKKLKATRGL